MITTMITAFGLDEEAFTQDNLMLIINYQTLKEKILLNKENNLEEDGVGPVTFCGTLVEDLAIIITILVITIIVIIPGVSHPL